MWLKDGTTTTVIWNWGIVIRADKCDVNAFLPTVLQRRNTVGLPIMSHYFLAARTLENTPAISTSDSHTAWRLARNDASIHRLCSLWLAIIPCTKSSTLAKVRANDEFPSLCIRQMVLSIATHVFLTASPLQQCSFDQKCLASLTARAVPADP